MLPANFDGRLPLFVESNVQRYSVSAKLFVIFRNLFFKVFFPPYNIVSK